MDKITTTSFCESYIENLVDYLQENYIKPGKDLSRIAIVFGGKRPSLFVKREIARQLKQPFYPPRFFTIDEFMSYLVRKKEDYQKTVDLDHCYSLYKLAGTETPHLLKDRGDFAQFLPWTREIINFIDHLDLEMVNDKSLLSVESNARIGYPVPDDINELLGSMVKLKSAYHSEMHKDQMYSRGFEYLRAAEMIDDISLDEFDEILFCNFFYFHRTEEKVVKSLFERGQARLIFQGDQRKWPVLERIATTFNHPLKEGDEPDTPAFKLNFYKGFDVHSQVGIVREILKKIKNLDKTVIVLPDPDHVIPLLSEMTSLIDEFNISMGYPLRRSSLYALFSLIFKSQNSLKENRYYAKDYLHVLRHPFVKNLNIEGDAAQTRILIHKIEEILTGQERASISGTSFIELEDIETCDELYMLTQQMLDRMEIKTNRKKLQNILETIHQMFFYEWEKIENFKLLGEHIEQFLDLLIKKSFMHQFPLNLNIASKMYEIKDEFLHASFNKEKFPKEDLFKIFDSKVSREIVAFVGSPLKGLQVLGLFETRSLNFENVIIMDVNEGALPKLNIYEPLIPREVMISLNLDRLELEEEIQRYQFMRLISSAKNVHLVYQQSKEKEKSRFIEELFWSHQKKKKRLETIPVAQARFEVKVGAHKTVIEKTPKMMEMLKKHTYSASSINTYLRDPLDFYYQYVLGLREQEDLLDEPESRHVGTFVHELLEHAFFPYIGKAPKFSKNFQDKFFNMFDQKFEDVFGKTMTSDSFLLRSVLYERLVRFLEHEQNATERQVKKILFLEHRFQQTIPLSCGKIKFQYIIDRIDELKDGTIMIVDYKTGSIDQMPRSGEVIENMELNRDTILENVRSFQIPLYFHYLEKEFKGKPVNAALYNLRTLELKSFLNGRGEYNKKNINKPYLRCLDHVVSEILDKNIPFESVE